jgi:hypothetical protein
VAETATPALEAEQPLDEAEQLKNETASDNAPSDDSLK